MSRPTLIVTRGLPGSGKSTRAKAWVSEDPSRRARVCRDDLRDQLHGGYAAQEEQITAVRDAAAVALLRQDVSVVIDETCLRTEHVLGLWHLAVERGARFEIWDMSDVPLDECIRRDATRPRPVTQDVIRDMHVRHIYLKPYPLPLPELVASDLDRQAAA